MNFQSLVSFQGFELIEIHLNLPFDWEADPRADWAATWRKLTGCGSLRALTGTLSSQRPDPVVGFGSEGQG